MRSIPGRENKWCKSPAYYRERKKEVAEEQEAKHILNTIFYTPIKIKKSKKRDQEAVGKGAQLRTERGRQEPDVGGSLPLLSPPPLSRLPGPIHSTLNVLQNGLFAA